MKTKKKKISNHRVILLIFFCFLSYTGCKKDLSTDQKLDEVYAIASQMENLQSLIIYYEGKIIREEYFGEGGPDIRHDVRSVTKSVSSLLIGIAIDKGFLNSVDQTLGEFIDPLIYTISSEAADIKIRHLLTMSGGFEWDEQSSYEAFNEWVLSDNQVQHLLDKPLVNQPGQYFNYNSAASHLLSVIITESTNMSTHDFAMKYLFEPLGTDQIEWLVDKEGFNYGGHGIKITPRDMIKIGTLILNQGVYTGNAIVSQNYIDESVKSLMSTNGTNNFGPYYGYSWWIGQGDHGSFSFANGYGGQFIVVEPNLDLIVVATNKWSGVGVTIANNSWYETIDLIINKILPAF